MRRQDHVIKRKQLVIRAARFFIDAPRTNGELFRVWHALSASRAWRCRHPTTYTETKRYLRNAAVPRRFLRSSHVRWWRPDWLAGVRGLGLRNVVANYPFEKSCRSAAIQPDSGHGDYSRLSCGVGDTQLET